MLKKNKTLVILVSIVTLLPILVGILLWNQLPEQMPTHWNAAGEIDDWSSKAFAVFGLPCIMLAGLWACIFASYADPKREAHSNKVYQLVLWIIPALSVVLHTIMYATALGKEVRVEMIMPVFMGLLFAIIGNYMPKCKQNYTIGIKIPWTLNNEENWNRTHRFAGWLWTACGLVIMLTGIFGGFWIFFAIVLLMVLAPVIYSYMLHRRGF